MKLCTDFFFTEMNCRVLSDSSGGQPAAVTVICEPACQSY